MLTLKQLQLKTGKTKPRSHSGYWVFPLLSHLIPGLTAKSYLPWQTFWACAILFILTALLHILKTTLCRQDVLWICLRDVQRGDYGSGTETKPFLICALLFAHMLRWHSTPFWETYHSEKKRNCSLLCELGELFHLYSWLLLSNWGALGGWHGHCRQHRSQDPDEGLDTVTPVPGMGNSC